MSALHHLARENSADQSIWPVRARPGRAIAPGHGAHHRRGADKRGAARPHLSGFFPLQAAGSPIGRLTDCRHSKPMLGMLFASAFTGLGTLFVPRRGMVA
jgi:hypothetical protein